MSVSVTAGIEPPFIVEFDVKHTNAGVFIAI